MYYFHCNTLFSLTSKLVISDELSLIIENNTNAKDLDPKQIDQLLSLTNSWMESLQKEINFIEDIMVGNQTMYCFYFFKLRLVYFHPTMSLKYQTLRMLVEATLKLQLVPLKKKIASRKVIFIIFKYIIICLKINNFYFNDKK